MKMMGVMLGEMTHDISWRVLIGFSPLISSSVYVCLNDVIFVIEA